MPMNPERSIMLTPPFADRRPLAGPILLLLAVFLTVAGCSGGGTLTSYVMALDDRVTCAAPACSPQASGWPWAGWRWCERAAR